MKSFTEDWEIIHRTSDWGKYPPEAVIRFVARNYYRFSNRRDIRMLDFGCGAGANTWYLAREGFDVYAFDGSPSAVKKAEQFLEKEGYTEVHFDVMDGVCITYPKDFFDCVIDNVCIYANTCVNIARMYEETYQILKDGGKLFTSCFGTQTDGYAAGCCLENGTYQNIEKGVLEGRGIAHFYTQSEFQETMERAGFANIKIEHMLYTDNGNQVEMFIGMAEK